jgi:hypothetical protein
MGLGQLLGPSPGRRAHPSPGTQVDSIVADGRLEVCDGAHGVFVMNKKSKAGCPTLRFLKGGIPRPLPLRISWTPRMNPSGGPSYREAKGGALRLGSRSRTVG